VRNKISSSSNTANKPVYLMYVWPWSVRARVLWVVYLYLNARISSGLPPT